jgi:molecular chaperone GrpE
MTEETTPSTETAVEEVDFSAAAPPHPAAAGTGEVSFGDAEAPAASELKIAQDKADDYLELALKAAAGHEDVVKGFAMVAGELQAALNRVGIQTFSPKGEVFDPNEHEAMAQTPVEGTEAGTVVEVYQSGYRINGAVLRPARVVVAG